VTVFEKFTDRARRVVVLAQEEARRLNHNYIGTEHLLLGLIREGEGVAARALSNLEISLEVVRQQLEEILGRGMQAPSGSIPFTPRAKKVLELSLRESKQLHHEYIGTEHLLLGLIREGEGVAAQVLNRLDAGEDRVRQEVVQLLAEGPSHDIPAPSVAESTGEPAPSPADEPDAEDVAGPTPRASRSAADAGTASAQPPAGESGDLHEVVELLQNIVARLDRIERRLGTGDDRAV
jgi:ATP-dependent Clp protease ATP-binding subunit ClpC